MANDGAGARLYWECHRGEQLDLPSFLDWVADRLVHVHGDSPNVDFVLALKERSKRIRLAMDLYETENTAGATLVTAEGAAPDLLAALKRARGYVAAFPHTDGDLAAIDAAIAKAERRSEA
jgi:hypothetical protein